MLNYFFQKGLEEIVSRIDFDVSVYYELKQFYRINIGRRESWKLKATGVAPHVMYYYREHHSLEVLLFLFFMLLLLL